MKRGWKDCLCELQNQGVCCEIMPLSNIRSYTHQVSPEWLPKQKLNKKNNNRHAKADKVKITRSQPFTSNYRHLGILRVGEIIFHIEEHSN